MKRKIINLKMPNPEEIPNFGGRTFSDDDEFNTNFTLKKAIFFQ